MESESKTRKISDFMELMKSKLQTMENPLKNNLSSINDTIELLDNMISTLLNPIKKLKISYNMRINSFKGKYRNALVGIRSKIHSIEKGSNSKENKTLNSQIMEEFNLKNKEISKEHGKLMNLLEDCLGSISSINNLFDTEEFKKIDEKTQGINLTKKKGKAPVLSLNEDESPEIENEGDEGDNNDNNAKNKGKVKKLVKKTPSKTPPVKTAEEKKRINKKIKNNGHFKQARDLNGNFFYFFLLFSLVLIEYYFLEFYFSLFFPWAF